MSPGSYPGQSTPLARFAVSFQDDHQCSRELPKCSACIPWPGLAIILATHSTVVSRLCSIERTLERLTALVENAVVQCSSEKEPRNGAQVLSRAHQSELFVGASHSFSFVREATENVRTTSGNPSRSSQQETDAQSELQFLSTSLTTAAVEPVHNTHAAGFYIPSRATGYKLIGTFLEHAPKGEPFFITPSEELLRQTVFSPGKFSHNAWLVYFNYTMLAQISTEQRDDGKLEAARFRQNVRITVNDSRIFLEPRQVNVQALALLAVHGEDYASPNLSWMLVGHTCRQVEALGLHVPMYTDIESYQRSLSMFWLLFVLDKSCALAFGRSPFLPMSLYRDVPLPDFSHLLKFQPPHLDLEFSTHFFIKGIELAKIMGTVVDMLALGSSKISRDTIRLQLEKWSHQTKEILNKTIEAERRLLEPAQLKEMLLGLNSLRFQYLHIMIILLKEEKSSNNHCLECAREALFILPSIVPNWSSVYNGVVWHLSYYPFIPFFVVFENLVHTSTSQTSATLDQHIGLLATTVSYFSSMGGQMQLLAVLCTRLENVAFVFLELARRYIRQRHATVNNTLDTSWPPMTTQADKNLPEVDSTEESFFGLSQGTLDEISLDDWLDVENFLNWLPADVFASRPPLGLEERRDPESASETPETLSTADLRGRKRPFNATFDWFSWDTYYASMLPT
ncbi:hypothetical protein BDP55DRAFT_693403 [Colletotrichum godetiae]|uniref:Xylanolytic transcriptional activator regulatory domain-containing protein n=1 Tax=Colletotrichum godetiae TaxID=1209918 RepID=A0AAJ0AMU3_9PEZI|nr:uncharacterized protein BDP55DRAFT_693403 [Colletotrichum godetiae]KAK1676145.1 hypothetical protein BDP55DRAFT_693403 [Colletotrichum godetiae]